MTADLDRTLSALADPVRRAVIDLLQREPHRSSELAVALAQSRPSMSRHLGVLRRAGLVQEVPETDPDADARVRSYELRREPFTQLRGWLERVESLWSAELVEFKRHVESRTKHRPG